MKVIATCSLAGGTHPIEILRDINAEFLEIPCKNPEEIISATTDADVIVTILTLQSFPKEVIEALDAKVRHIASAGIGFDNIDLEAATEKRIVVTNTKSYCVDEVSDHTMALILSLNRKLSRVEEAARALKWRTRSAEMLKKVLPPLKKLRGQTLGLIGFGDIARAVIPKAKTFGMEVIAYSPNLAEEVAMLFEVRKVSLETLLKKSDFVSLHAGPKKKIKILKEEHFRLMKPTAYFINTARGWLVDENALIKALQEKWISGAGLDVMDQEPPLADNPLLKMNNVIITGHSAQYSDDSEKELWAIPLRNAVLTLQGKFPSSFAVNPEVEKKWLEKWSEKRRPT